jgi:hypothetical protein
MQGSERHCPRRCCIVVPKGVEHCPVADDEVHVLLFEPAGVRNTGNISDDTFTATGRPRL